MIKKLFKYLPQTVAMLFLAGFVAYAWTEPSVAPPNGNVDAPINVGPNAQTKAGDFTVNGVVKTLKDLIVGSVTIKSDGSVSPGLNAEKAENSQKLGGYSARDVSESGSVTGTITLGGSFYGGVCGGWGCNSCICVENTTCSVQGKGFCNGTIMQGYMTGVSAANYTAYQPVCDLGETLTLVGTQGTNQSCYQPFQCPTRTYQCVKPRINFPGCGNSIMEAGEGCEDGNQLNNIGNCSADCSKSNYFYQPQVGAYIRNDAASAGQYCKEKGMAAGYAKLNALNLQQSYPYCNPSWPPSYGNCPSMASWDGSSWKITQPATFLVIQELWCSP